MMSKLPRSSAGNELVPLILDHLGFDAELRRERFGEITFKADELLGLSADREKRRARRLRHPRPSAARRVF